MLAGVLLKRLIKVGTLRVVDARGKAHLFSGEPGPEVTIRLHDKALHTRLFWNPQLHVGEGYMDETLTIEEGAQVFDFLDLVGMNLRYMEDHWVIRWHSALARLVRPLQQYNPVGGARKNVAHHYDLSDTLFDLFLDSDRQYSCGYFESPNNSLEQAQLAKKRHLASKLLLEPGAKVLDIGSGWGGLALYLANVSNVDVTGVTLSSNQHEYSERRARTAGVADRVRFELRDYREVTGTYDRIVSVGMFEHVGVRHYGEFFRVLRERLAEDGVALLHTISRFDVPTATSPWARKYIFPGGYCPALSEVFAAIERSGLKVTDIENLRLHYAETLICWARNFRSNRARVAEIYDERFCRMWEFYLAGAEVNFRHQNLLVSQIQLARRQDAVPLTRDYMYDWERAHV